MAVTSFRCQWWHQAHECDAQRQTDETKPLLVTFPLIFSKFSNRGVHTSSTLFPWRGAAEGSRNSGADTVQLKSRHPIVVIFNPTKTRAKADANAEPLKTRHFLATVPPRIPPENAPKHLSLFSYIPAGLGGNVFNKTQEDKLERRRVEEKKWLGSIKEEGVRKREMRAQEQRWVRGRLVAVGPESRVPCVLSAHGGK